MSICGDPTCESYGCTQAAIDAWNAAREADARAIVRHVLGLPAEPAEGESKRYPRRVGP